MFGLRKRRRAYLRAQPLDARRREVLDGGVPYYRLLSADVRAELEGLVQVFLEEKHFEGCGGHVLGEEQCTVIAGNACVLLLGRETGFYPLLSSVLIYPDAFVAPVRHHYEDGTVGEHDEVRAGESWSAGSVVLSWEDIERDLFGDEPGYNVIIHEFAHQLDAECPDGEGLPVLPGRAMQAEWSRVFTGEYQALCRALERGEEPLLGDYAAESPAEFFAVATETFFTLPVDLQSEHPALYEQLSALYRQNPAALCRSAGVDAV